jgi:regulator of protease activity HflC (stomatin/prohibitin superfamily)
MKKKLVVGIIVAVLAVVVILQSVVVVDSGKSGVMVTLGAVEDMVLQEGFHFKTPFVQQVVQINNRTQKTEVSGTAASKDLQTVTTDVAVNYRVLNNSSASLYKNVGLDYESVIIAPAIQESIKAVTAKFTAEQLITERSSVGEQIRTMLSNKINPYGLEVEVFNIVNFDFSEEFNAAVEAKQTAEQNALKAQQDLNRIKIEAQQKVESAKAEAESIKLIQETLETSPQYIEYIKWNKWDGRLPTVMGESDFILDVGDPVTEAAQEPAAAE